MKNHILQFAFCLNYIVDFTPCISPVPHDTPALEKIAASPMKEDDEVTGVRKLFGKTLCIWWAYNSLHVITML